MHPNTPYKWLKRMCKKNGLPFYGVHTFRHLNASLQINAGIDAVTVSATLGHSTPTTTIPVPNSNTIPVAVHTDYNYQNP